MHATLARHHVHAVVQQPYLALTDTRHVVHPFGHKGSTVARCIFAEIILCNFYQMHSVQIILKEGQNKRLVHKNLVAARPAHAQYECEDPSQVYCMAMVL